MENCVRDMHNPSFDAISTNSDGYFDCTTLLCHTFLKFRYGYFAKIPSPNKSREILFHRACSNVL